MPYENLFSHFPKECVAYHEPLAKHTTFAIGGPCDVWLAPYEIGQVQEAWQICQKEGIPIFALGKGSNLLVSDAGMDGVVLSMEHLQALSIQGDTITCQAGMSMEDLCNRACQAGLSGLEFACGIPGTLGGAIYMNAGAYEGEMKDVVVSVQVMTPEGEIKELSAQEAKFSYRHSLLKEQPLLCLSATMRLHPEDKKIIQAKMDDLMERRRSRQPLELASAGSAFKRPTGYYAGKLIIEAGMQGHRIGDAQVSTKHAGFIVNLGQASAQNVVDLIAQVKEAVYAHSGVSLEPEVRLIGRW